MTTEPILSDKNPLLKQVRRAVQRGTLTDDGFAVAESFHLLEEALRSGCEIRTVIVADSAKGIEHITGLKRTRIVSVPDSLFDELASTESPQGIIALVKPATWTIDQIVDGPTLLVVLDGIQDPGNAGAIVRAAEAFGATGTAFLKGTANPYNPKCLRASAGSLFRLPVIAALDPGLLIAALEARGIRIFAAMPVAELTATNADLRQRCALVIGSEGRGVSGQLAAKCTALRIPTSSVESLNAAVAAGVLLYEASRQRSGA